MKMHPMGFEGSVDNYQLNKVEVPAKLKAFVTPPVV